MPTRTPQKHYADPAIVPLPPRPASGRPPSARRGVRRTHPAPAEIRLSFEVVLHGETPYSDAVAVIDGVRLLTEQVGAAGLTIAAGEATDRPRVEPARPVRDLTVHIFPEMRAVTVGPYQVELTKIEFDLILFLAERPRTVFTRLQLLQGVWGHLHTGERTVDVHIRRVRAKVCDDLITTVRGVGYRLADDQRVRIVRPGL